MNIKGILFDLDQTLLNRDQSLACFLTWQWHEHQPLQVMNRHEFITKFLKLDQNGKVWKDEVYDLILDEYNVSSIKSAYLVDEYLSNFPVHAVLFADVVEVLQRFKNMNIKLGIITNGRQDLQSAVINACGLQQMMDTILISEIEGVKKPDAAIFKIGLDRLALQPELCVFIGDNPDADIMGAYNAGIKTIWKKNDYFVAPDSSLNSSVLSEFCELPSIITSL